jgi:hypothetical protein
MLIEPMAYVFIKINNPSSYLDMFFGSVYLEFLFPFKQQTKFVFSIFFWVGWGWGEILICYNMKLEWDNLNEKKKKRNCKSWGVKDSAGLMRYGH